MKKVVLLASFFTATPLVIFLSIIYFFFLSYHNEGKVLSARTNVSYAALPTADNLFYSQIDQTDSRTELVRQFFKKYRSPLEPYAEDVVTIADKYGLDFKLIPAIAMQESNLCLKAPANSFNCWGFGIYGGKVTRFDSYTQGIEAVTKTLATKYKADGLETPEEIMARYTPNSKGSWAQGVNQFMAELQ
jgi:hypothetical protein